MTSECTKRCYNLMNSISLDKKKALIEKQRKQMLTQLFSPFHFNKKDNYFGLGK